MKNKSQLKAGVILSYINLALGSIIPLIYTPVMLRMLGQEEYGLYSLANSVIGYLSLLSFGMGSTIVRYVTKYKVENEKDKEERVIGLFLIIYIVMAVLVLIGGYILSMNVDQIFHRGLTEAEIDKIRILIYIMTFNTAISFPISVFSSITIAHEKYLFRKLVDMLSSIAVPVSNIFVLYMGMGSIGISLVSTFLQFSMLPINAYYCFNKLKIRPQFKHIPFYMLKEICGFSIFVFLGSVVDMLFWSTDKVILGALIGTAATAVYNVGGMFSNMLQNLSTGISGVLIPKITGMVIQEQNKKIWSNMFIRIGRLQYYIIALVLSGFIVFGQPFVMFIAGEGYGDAYIIALLTMIPLSIPLIQNTGLNIVIAQNKHQFRSVVYLIIAIINVISTYLIVPYLGGIGAAFCSCLAYLAGQGVIMNIYYYKVTGLDVPLFWKNILNLSIIPFSMLLSSIVIFHYIKINSVFTFLIGVIIYTLIYIILMWKLKMNEYEKDLFIKPALKIKNLVVNRGNR